MQKKMEIILERYSGVSAWAIVILLISAVNLISTPLLNSGDDAFLMYTLAGGYGEAPTALLHYNYGWHFFLGTLIKSAYNFSPSINWYTLFLLLIQTTGLAAILYVLLKRMPVFSALLYFFIAFFFIEVRLLLSLSFTGTAIVTSMAANCLLIHQLQTGSLKNRSFFGGLVLLLLAGLLRMHAVWLALALMWPLAVTLLKRKQIIQWGLITALALLLLWGLNGLHQQYYRKQIPGWSVQEEYRQALFAMYNRPHQLRQGSQVFTDSAEMQLYDAGFLYDTTRFSKNKMAAIGKEILRTRSFANQKDREGFYWFWMEIRIYAALFALFCITAILQGRKKVVQKWLVSLLAFLSVNVFLFVFMKVTTTLHLGMLLICWASLAMHIRDEKGFVWRGKAASYVYALFLFLLFAWMGYRVAGENSRNKIRHQRFLCALQTINQHRDKLFVATYDIFPLDYFYTWDAPSRFPVTNLLYKDRLLTHTYPFTLQRFGITDINKALYDHPGIYLLGPPLPALLRKDQQEIFTGPLPGFGCLEVRQITKKP